MGRLARAKAYRAILISLTFLLVVSLAMPAHAATVKKTDLGTFYYSAPYGIGRGGVTYQDGLMYDNRDPRYGYNVLIKFEISPDAKIYRIVFYGDAQGVSSAEVVKANTGKKPSATVYLSMSGGYTESRTFDGSRTTFSEVRLATGSDAPHNDSDAYAKVEVDLGGKPINGTVEFTFNVYTEALGVDKVDVRFFSYVVIEYYDPAVGNVVSKTVELQKDVTVSKPPFKRFILAATIAIVSMGIVYALSVFGFFESFTTVDLVTIAVIGAFQAVRVQIIGRQLVFPVLDRVPGAYNFAVADFPYIMLLIIAAYIVRKPGVVTLTLFLYNIISEIGRYGINPLRRAYPFAQGLVPDLYLLARYKLTSVELFADKPLFRSLTIGHIDGFLVGFFRGLFMQLSLYLVFFPVLFRLQYEIGYVLYRITIPRAIGNGIEGAISVPIAKKIYEAVQYRIFPRNSYRDPTENRVEIVIHPVVAIPSGLKDVLSAVFLLIIVLPLVPGAVAYLLFKILGISGFRRLFSYESRESSVHRLHPLTKLLTSSAIGVGVALIDSFLGLLVMLALALLIRIPANPSERKVRGLSILLLSNFLLIGRSQSFLNPAFSRVVTGSARGLTVLYVFPKSLRRMSEGITVEGFVYGAVQSVRVVAALSAALRFISTTHPSEIVYGFKAIRFPVEVTFMIAVAIKSIPSILEKTSVVISAERARAMEIVPRKLSRNVFKQVVETFRALIVALLPVIIETLREARQMALAATIKGFRAYKKRTYYKEIEMTRKDVAITLGVLGLLAFLVAAQFLAYKYAFLAIFQRGFLRKSAQNRLNSE